ncbi:hypothetical protein AWRI1631_31130 [Saccharomyces cerevisiae AWRI1631]|uniref:Uncharacterized protein n=1 Tax=Saccharomyces cerevisiae (strain AWRI1631) TaxID=545124 RepID=B5VEZ8_YEAS6|nr:hypothetical protein AWRI1631_31130 [Saccharomyces cerevisiae AWRI1631]
MLPKTSLYLVKLFQHLTWRSLLCLIQWPLRKQLQHL